MVYVLIAMAVLLMVGVLVVSATSDFGTVFFVKVVPFLSSCLMLIYAAMELGWVINVAS